MFRLINLVLYFGLVLSLGGCRWVEGMFIHPVYFPSELWFKPGYGEKEIEKNFSNCYPEGPGLFNQSGEHLIIAERCMLANGFRFRDYGWLHNLRPHSVCSKKFAEFRGLKTHMDLPSCQSLRGQYKP